MTDETNTDDSQEESQAQNVYTVELTGRELEDLREMCLIAGDMGVQEQRADELRSRLNHERVKNIPVIAFCGLPGAGKTAITDFAANAIDGAVSISMGDAIRDNAPEQIAAESESLGEFAARTREDDPRTIPEWVVDIASNNHGANAFVIDGVRSVTDFRVLDDYFNDFDLINVKADFYTRLDRVQDRGREREAEFDAHDLVNRDEHELDKLGLRGVLEWSDDQFLPDDINMGQAGLHNFVFTNEGVDGENLERQVFDFVASLSKFESYVDLGDNLDRAAQQ